MYTQNTIYGKVALKFKQETPQWDENRVFQVNVSMRSIVIKCPCVYLQLKHFCGHSGIRFCYI